MDEEIERLKKELSRLETCMLRAMDYITEALIEVNAFEYEHGIDDVLHARKVALVESMTKLMDWEGAKKYGYDWNVEEEFPI